MKKIANTLLLLVITMTGAACCTPTTVTVPKNVLITPPANLMVDCPISPPPDRPSFQAAQPKDQTAMALGSYSTQAGNTAVCNKRQAELRAWVTQQTGIYSTPPATGGK